MRRPTRRHPSPLYRWLIVALTLCLLAGAHALETATMDTRAAHATTLRKLDMASLVSGSERIVRGEVAAIEPAREDGRIVTYVTIEVSEHLKSQDDIETVRVRVLGGRMDGLATRVHGTADFSLGEHVLVFLERPQPDGPLVVRGMVQGKFTVALGPDTKTLYVVPDLRNTPLVEPVELRGQEGELRKRLREANPSQTHDRVHALEEVRAEIRRQLDEDAAATGGAQ